MNAQGHVLRSPYRDWRVFIPFVCRRCGKCCREVGVHPGHIEIFAVAEHLGVSVDEVIEHYLGGKIISHEEGEVTYNASIHHPCPFLRGNECLIYPVRPAPCKAFPVETDCRDFGIGCPAMEEVRRAWRALGGGSVDSFNGEVCYMQPERWRKFLTRYRGSRPSKDALELFLKFNQPCQTEKGV